jgi:NAD-dependent dihydropyrimidine dehydrogenase PreA subunit
MPYVIAAACIDVMDRSCIDECPVDCIYEGRRKLYINPAECIDCGACEPVCPVTAISQDRRVPADQLDFVQDGARFFAEPLPGRDGPLGTAGGAGGVGPLGVDTRLVASYGAA